VDVLIAFVATGGSVADAAASIGIRPSTAKRHMADLRARTGLSTEQLIYRGRAEGWLVVPDLEPGTSDFVMDPRKLAVSTETATATNGPHLDREGSSRRGTA
jgi:hypothetical protein